MKDELERLARRIARGDRSAATAEAYVRAVRALDAGRAGDRTWFPFEAYDAGQLGRRLEAEDDPLEFPAGWLRRDAADRLSFVVPFSEPDDVTLRLADPAISTAAPGDVMAASGLRRESRRFHYALEARPRRGAKVLEVERAAPGREEWSYVLRGTFDPKAGGVVPVALLRIDEFGNETPIQSGVYVERLDAAAGGAVGSLRWLSGRTGDRSANLRETALTEAIIESREWTRLVEEHALPRRGE